MKKKNQTPEHLGFLTLLHMNDYIWNVEGASLEAVYGYARQAARAALVQEDRSIVLGALPATARKYVVAAITKTKID